MTNMFLLSWFVLLFGMGVVAPPPVGCIISAMVNKERAGNCYRICDYCLTPAPPAPPTTSQDYDCSEGDPETWDVRKKVTCCLQVGKGCPTIPSAPASTTSPCSIDCNAGYNDLDPLQWVRGWSGEKKLYCCKTANRGCPAELPPPSGLPPSDAPPEADKNVYDCDAGYHHLNSCLVESWSPQKIDHCGSGGEEPERRNLAESVTGFEHVGEGNCVNGDGAVPDHYAAVTTTSDLCSQACLSVSVDCVGYSWFLDKTCIVYSVTTPTQRSQPKVRWRSSRPNEEHKNGKASGECPCHNCTAKQLTGRVSANMHFTIIYGAILLLGYLHFRG